MATSVTCPCSKPEEDILLQTRYKKERRKIWKRSYSGLTNEQVCNQIKREQPLRQKMTYRLFIQIVHLFQAPGILLMGLSSEQYVICSIVVNSQRDCSGPE